MIISFCSIVMAVCTENPIRVDKATESPMLAK
jgi:hypothetical protein